MKRRMTMNRRMQMHQIHIQTTNPQPKIKVSMPVVTGGTSQAAIQTMNKAIKDTTAGLIKDQGYPSADVQEMDGMFEIKNNQRGVLSLSILNYSYTGGAHGNTLQKSLTF